MTELGNLGKHERVRGFERRWEQEDERDKLVARARATGFLDRARHTCPKWDSSRREGADQWPIRCRSRARRSSALVLWRHRIPDVGPQTAPWSFPANLAEVAKPLI